MKTTFLSLLTLPALFFGAIAAPAQADSVATRGESKTAQAAAIVEALDAEVKEYTADMSKPPCLLPWQDVILIKS